MQINYAKQNPFTRNYLVKPDFAYGFNNKSLNVQRKYDDSNYNSRVEHYPLNIWSFRDNHDSNFAPFLPSRNYTEISSFQKQMMLSSATSRKSNYNNNMRTSRIESNPFYRKNLLISRQKLEQQIQRDLNMITYYESPRKSNQRSNYQQRQSVTTSYQPNQIANASIMMNLIGPGNDNNESRRNSRNMSQQRESPKRNLNPETAQPHSSHSKFQQTITVRGQKFHKAKIYPASQ